MLNLYFVSLGALARPAIVSAENVDDARVRARAGAEARVCSMGPGTPIYYRTAAGIRYGVVASIAMPLTSMLVINPWSEQARDFDRSRRVPIQAQQLLEVGETARPRTEMDTAAYRA